MIEDKDLNIMQILSKIRDTKEKAVEDYKKELREKIMKQKPLSPTIKSDTYHQGVDDAFNIVLSLLERKS